MIEKNKFTNEVRVKVVHLQIFTTASGKAAPRLHSAFLKNGIDSRIITLRHEINDDDRTIQKGKRSLVVSWIDNIIQSFLTRNTVKKFGQFFYPVLGSDVSQMEVVKEADFIYIHWVLGGFLNLNQIEKLAKLGKPILFFMHDMWPITGGCFHSFSCEKYKSGCSNCQIFPEDRAHDLSFRQFNAKVDFYSKYDNLYYISPSKWLYNCAKESALTKHKQVFHIPNILDKELFKPLEKRVAKQILNINPCQVVIAFGATHISSSYKGLSYFKTALKILSERSDLEDVLILIFGSGYKKEIADDVPFKTKFLGHLGDEYSAVVTYNAADVFVSPSLADNLPTTILESLHCGTPVVAFNVGGIPDMIDHKKNGYLAKYRDAEDLAVGIRFCLENKMKGYVLPDFDSTVLLNKHFALFNQLKSSNKVEGKLV